SDTKQIDIETHFFIQAEDGIRDFHVTGVQTCALPISADVAEGEQTITVTTAGGKGTKMFTVTATVPDPPTITSVSPESLAGVVRSEERRVGKESRSRWPSR